MQLSSMSFTTPEAPWSLITDPGPGPVHRLMFDVIPDIGYAVPITRREAYKPMKNKETTTWQDEKASERFAMISPLLAEDLDPAKKSQLRSQIADSRDVSERTLYRFEAAWRRDGFNGLRPMNRKMRRSQNLPENFDEIIGQAVQLKREVPGRSVAQIILILEMEGWAPPGVLKRSTLQRYLYRAGLGIRQMKRYTEARNATSRRFCKPHRMMLAQCDIKYGLKLPVGEGGKKVQTYLSALIDDHSRYILWSEWYDNQEAVIVEDTFHKAILHHGVMDAAFSDNGKQYVSTQLTRALSRLGIRYMHAKPYHAWSKGLIERFNLSVDSFLDEVRLKDVKSMEELNGYWKVWVEEYYHNKPHDGIREYYKSLGAPVPEGGITPEQEWNRDSRKLKYLDAAVVAEAFLHHETRELDKSGCLSFEGRKYDVSISLAGRTVEIAYDPMAPETITVTCEGTPPITAKPLAIPEFCDKSPVLPASMQDPLPETSRFLDGLKKQAEKSRQHRMAAISFAGYGKEG